MELERHCQSSCVWDDRLMKLARVCKYSNPVWMKIFKYQNVFRKCDELCAWSMEVYIWKMLYWTWNEVLSTSQKHCGNEISGDMYYVSDYDDMIWEVML